MDESRPSKKQRELLQFIDGFIKGYGYGPSYREIMRALNYKSVSTVATHVDNLITKGHLIKKDNSARSLAVTADVKSSVAKPEQVETPKSSHQEWLVHRTQLRIDAFHKKPDESKKEQIQHLIESVRQLVDVESADKLTELLAKSD